MRTLRTLMSTFSEKGHETKTWFHLYVILTAFNLFYLVICCVFKYLSTKYSSQVQRKWRSNQKIPKSTQAVSSTLCQRPAAAACAHMVNNLTHCLENTPAQFLRNHFTEATQFQSQLVSGLLGWLVNWSIFKKALYISAFFWFTWPWEVGQKCSCLKAATLNLH